MKDRLAAITAVIMLASGMGLTIAGFIVEPRGEVHDSVLWYTAQTLIYAGSVFGVKTYIDGKLKGRGQ